MAGERTAGASLLRYAMAGGVVAFSTTRHGGDSHGAYASLNVNPYCGDDPSNVCHNHALLCGLLGIEKDELVFPHQVHGTESQRLDASFLSLTQNERRHLLEGRDALMTDVQGLCVAVSTADCVPLLLFDVRNKAVAAVHAGWRGTLQGIASRTLGKMERYYGSRPEDIHVVIGPHISLAAFEVGGEVYEQFLSASFPMCRMAERRGGRWHLSLSQANRWMLERDGVLSEHIEDVGICSYFNEKDFFSARRLGIHSGRTLTGIMLMREDADGGSSVCRSSTRSV